MRQLLLLLPLVCLPACQNVSISDGIWDEGMPSPRQAAANAFASPDADERRRCIGLLAGANFGGEPAYIKLYHLTLGDKDGSVRAAAARALAERGGPEDLPALKPMLADTDKLTRLAATEAFVRIDWQGMPDKAEVQTALIALLKEEDVDLRAAAAIALSQQVDEVTFNALSTALEDLSWSVAARAQDGLIRLVGQDLGADGREWSNFLKDQKAKGADPFVGHKPYAWLPYRRRSTAVQWGWWWDSPTEWQPARTGPRRGKVATGEDAAKMQRDFEAR